MNIETISIDHASAGIDIRERFSFTGSEKIQAVKQLKKTEGVLGCVMIATCNRTELWVSLMPDVRLNLAEILCGFKQADKEKYQQYLRKDSGTDAVRHLFYLASGLRSQIMGEDQILSQVKDAITLSREYGCADQVLEVLFRMAVTAGKEIKTKIAMPKSNHSAPQAAIEQLEREGYCFAGKTCLVVGNGIMGKLTAQLLMDRRADVTVTVRQYKSGVVDIPADAKRINYGERYTCIPGCDFVFSATASPNITIRTEQLLKLSDRKEQVFVDLAVPRDIETSVAELKNTKLYNMDDFHIDAQSEEMRQLLAQADLLLAEKIQEFSDWYEAKDAVPVLLKLSRQAAKDVAGRMNKPIQKANVQDPDLLREAMETSVQKVVNKLMFGIRDTVDVATFRECLLAMEALYDEEDDTVK